MVTLFLSPSTIVRSKYPRSPQYIGIVGLCLPIFARTIVGTACGDLKHGTWHVSAIARGVRQARSPGIPAVTGWPIARLPSVEDAHSPPRSDSVSLQCAIPPFALGRMSVPDLSPWSTVGWGSAPLTRQPSVNSAGLLPPVNRRTVLVPWSEGASNWNDRAAPATPGVSMRVLCLFPFIPLVFVMDRINM
jgi:hypothetical protein